MDIGWLGERIAAEYLRRQGYKLLYQRWRKGSHEIDIIAWDKGELVFVEVRTVGKHTAWAAEQTIGRHKQAGLRRAIEVFLSENPEYSLLPARIDVVAVRLSAPPEVVLLVDAFR
ncbi:MAG: YraN family protein [Bacteroidia bacterium]